jgi:hypothetical protein
MHNRSCVRSQLMAILVIAMSASADAAVVALPPGEYDVTIETVLPHLEEALRYATTRTHRCLREPDATDLFPLLAHQAFAGCILVPDPDAPDGTRFILHCKNPEAATGSAAFDVTANHVSAVVDVKMGAKNMTLSQRLHGSRVGACRASDSK